MIDSPRVLGAAAAMDVGSRSRHCRGCYNDREGLWTCMAAGVASGLVANSAI